MKSLIRISLLFCCLLAGAQTLSAQTVYNTTCADMEVRFFYDDPYQGCGGNICWVVEWYVAYIPAGSSHTFTKSCFKADFFRVEAVENSGTGFADWVRPYCTGSVVDVFDHPCGSGYAYGVLRNANDFYIYGF